MGNALEKLGLLLGDIYDLEFLTYEVGLRRLRKGILIPLSSRVIKDQLLLNLLLPYCNFFNENNNTYLAPGKLKKPHIFTRFRTYLDAIPVCIDDVLEVSLLDEEQNLLFSTLGLVSAISASTISLPTIIEQKLWLKIRLDTEGGVRPQLEQELNSQDYFQGLLKKFKENIRQRNYVPNTHTIHKRLDLLKIEPRSSDLDAKIFYDSKFPDLVTSAHFTALTTDLMVLENILEHFYKNVTNKKLFQLAATRKLYGQRLQELKGLWEQGAVLNAPLR